MRYDSDRDVYRDCKWCGGQGCNQCQIESDKAYKKQFPDGPKPIATFTTEQVKAGVLKSLLSPDSIASAEVEARVMTKEQLGELVISGLGMTKHEMEDALTRALVHEIIRERIGAAGQQEKETTK